MSLEELFDEFVEEEPKKEEKPKKAKKPEEKPKETKLPPKPEIVEEEAVIEEPTPEEPVEVPEEKPEVLPEEKPVEAPTEEVTEDFFESTTTETVTTTEKVEVPPMPKPETPTEFDFSEDKGIPKEAYVIYGMKGHGKTALAFSFPGTIACLSFDRKSLRVKKLMYKNDPRIKVYDAVRYMDYSSPEIMLETAEITFRYINALLDHIRDNVKPDWIVIDGSEIFERICEMVMRYRNNLMPFQGIANRNLWKERRMYIKQIHDKALNAAKKGIIYTTYTTEKEIVQDGELIAKEDVPRWIDAILYETDTVIKVEAVWEQDTQKYYAKIESSKGSLPSGIKKEVTGKGIKVFTEG